MVGAFGVDDGVLNVRTLVLDTTDTKVVGTGTANLGRETLDLKFTPYPKDVSLLSGRSPVTVQGLFKKPEVGIDPKGLVARGPAAAALGGLRTPPASFLADRKGVVMGKSVSERVNVGGGGTLKKNT